MFDTWVAGLMFGRRNQSNVRRQNAAHVLETCAACLAECITQMHLFSLY